MELTAGTRLGQYEILNPIGAGGMGQVYRARDTQLDRDVALKVLPQAFASDPERLARFEREAKTLASLNHPNIAHLHGLERSGATRALVMELVQGEDLSVQIGRGPLAQSDSLPIARQMAEALEAAHDLGIVHRDLKPANVMVRADGVVKVLDFGLAKALDANASNAAANAMNSPTLTAQTQFGMILGTAAYMAPEQARGKSVDKRADIWAFGVVLFEMLTGERVFKGDEISDVLAAVLRQDIDWSRLPVSTPPRLRRLLERCLDRDPKTRLRDIGEARVELARLERGATEAETTAGAVAATPASTGRSRREVLAWSVAALAVITSIGFSLSRSTGAAPPDPGRVVRLTFLAPDNVVAEAGGALISPDGEKLLFSGRGADGRRLLWVRRLDSLEATPLPDSEDALEPFWAPNSKSIAFGAQGKLKRLDLGTARAQVLTDAARSNNGTWSPSGTIVFSPDYRSPLFRVSADGGPRTPVTQMAPASGGHRYPAFLPDGRHFLYLANANNAAAIVVGSVDSMDTKVVLFDSAPAIYAKPGRLIYIKNGTLVSHAFDADRLELSGEAVPISAPPLGANWAQGARASVSDTGVLVVQGAPQYDYQLAWYERGGKPGVPFGPVRKVTVAEFPRISPDGKRVVVQRFDPATQNQDLWMGDLTRGTFERFTTNPAQEQLAFWSIDGKSVFCSTARNGVGGIYRIPIGGGAEQLMVKGTVFPSDSSPDGNWFFFTLRGETTRSDIWEQAATDDAKAAEARPARAVIQSEADEVHAQISPDSHWLAYTSDIAGTAEVYVARLAADGTVSDARRVSQGGGVQPRWSRDGRELFFVNAAQGFLSAQFMAVSVRTGSGTAFEFGDATPLFKVRMLPIQSVIRDYDISLEGQRFLVGSAVGDARATPATIVLNWLAGVK